MRRLQCSSSPFERQAAATVLCNLAYDPEHSAAIVAAGSIPTLVRCLELGSGEDLVRAAATALGNLSAHCPDSKAAMAAAGAIPLLVGHLSSSSDAVRPVTAAALGNINSGKWGHADAVTAA